MEKDLLQAVVKVESEIQQSIESERKKAAAWLESVRVSLSGELEAQKRQLEAAFTGALATAGSECELQAREEIAAANRLAEFMQQLPRETLEEIVLEFLPRILPADKR